MEKLKVEKEAEKFVINKFTLNLDQFSLLVSSKNTAVRAEPGLGINVWIHEYVRWDEGGVEFSSLEEGCFGSHYEVKPTKFSWKELEEASTSGKDFSSRGILIPNSQFKELLGLKAVNYESGDKTAVKKILRDLSSKS